MPLFYFDLVDDEESLPDNCGIELADVVEARIQAQALLPDIAREKLPDGDRRDLSVTVRSSEGLCCYKAVLTIQGEWMVPRELR
jgi:hypothetical protein